MAIGLLAAPAAHAQGRDTGALLVHVVDPDGASLAGVTVTVTGPQRGRAATTMLDGVARYSGLIPGIYSVEVTLSGFGTTRQEDIRVEAGRSIQIDVLLRIAPVEEVLVIEGASPVIDPRAAHVGAIVDADLINLTPSGFGLFASVLDKVPGLVMSGVDVGGANGTQQQVFTAHGSLLGQNQFNVNGSPVNDISTGAIGMFYGIPAFAEVEVSTAAHDIEHQTPGVVVNMVSKSGTNRWQGSARFYYSNDSLAGDNVSDDLAEQGVRSGNPNTLLSDLDLQVGGPIVRDRLWAFVDHSRFNEARLIVGLPEQDQDERSLRNFTANVDWQVAPEHRISARYFYARKFRLNLGAGPEWPVESSRLQSPSSSHVVQMNWISTWSADTFADVRAAYRDDVFGFIGRRPDSPAPHPNYPTGIPSTYDFFTGEFSGMPWESRFWNRTYSANAAVSHVVTGASVSHDLKIGGSWMHGQRDEIDVDSLGLFQWYAGGSPFSAQIANTPAADLEDLGPGNGAAEHTSAFSLYAQDSLRIGTRWNVSAGLRYDYSKLWIPAQTRPASWWSGLVPADEFGEAFTERRFESQDLISWSDLTPRIAVTYDLSGRGQTVVKASYSEYSLQQNTNVAETINPLQYGANEYLWNDTNGDGVFQWDERGDLIWAFHPGINTATDPDLRSSRTREITAGLEHQLGNELVLGVTAIYRTVANPIDDINTGIPYGPIAERLGVPSSYTPVETIDPGPDGILGTADDGGPLTVWNQDRSTFGNNFYMVTNPAAWGFDTDYSYRGLELVARKRFSRRWQMLGSWTIGRIDSNLAGGAGINARGVFDNPNADIGRAGRSAEDRTHVVKLNGSYLFADPIGVNLAVSLRHESGLPVRRFFRLPRGLVNQGRPSIVAGGYGVDDNPASLGGRLDSITLLDLRLEKQFAISGAGRLTLMLDAFNILNDNSVRSAVQGAGPVYGQPRAIVPPRMLRLGLGWWF